MTVIPFPRTTQSASGWRAAELCNVTEACKEPLARGEISGWERGFTEAGDPQLYVLGPAPERECYLCISRLGGNYVLEDGQGRVLLEHEAVEVLARQMRDLLGRKRARIVGRIVVGWAAVREAFEERIEPLMAEPLEVASHFVPQLAVLA